MTRFALVLLIASSVATFADDKVHFFGESWKPRAAVRDLWLPLQNSWWDSNLGFGSPAISAHFKDFARRHPPERIIPEIFADLKVHHTELTEIGYTYLMAQWPRRQVMGLLQPFLHSRDPEVKAFAEDVESDLSDWPYD